MTHYEVLGVASTATTAERLAAVRKKQKEHHPDHGGDRSRFEKIAEAKAVLTDPLRRRHYDMQLSAKQQVNAHGSATRRHPVAIFLEVLEELAAQPKNACCMSCGRRLVARLCSYCWTVNP